MELVERYLKEKYTYRFWIADKNHEIWDIVHQGITMEEYPVYLNVYKANIRMLDEHYKEINAYASGWKKRHPKIIRENPLGETQAFEVIWEGDFTENGITSIRCKAVLI